MKQNKLNAFTLSELLVVLVVSSIVISMTFLVLNMVRKQVVSIQENYQKKQEVRFFEARFSRDFNSHNASYDPKKKSLKLTNTKDSIRYVFSDLFIIREKDTFPIEVAKIHLFLDGTTVREKTIDAIAIALSSRFANQQLFIHQTKDAAYYINTN